MKTEQKTAAVLSDELNQARADLATAEGRALSLENAGAVTEKAINELASLNAKAQLLRGAIRRLETELPIQERIEAQTEIERLQDVVSCENVSAKKAAETLMAKAVTILVPKPDSHPAWSFAYCERRKHEIGIFAAEHPMARVHTDKARDAKAEIERLRKKIAV